MAKIDFSTEARKQTTVSCNDQFEADSFLPNILISSTKAHSKSNSMFLKKLRSQGSCPVSGEFSQKHPELPLQVSILGLCSDRMGQ